MNVGDEVTSTVQYQDAVYIFTKHGTVWRMWVDNVTRTVQFERIYQFV